MNSKENPQFIYGTRAIIEAIEAGKEIDKLFVQKGLRNDLIKELLQLTSSHQIPVSLVPVEKLNRLTRKNHQGAVGFVSAVSFASLDNIINQAYQEGRDPLLVVLDEVTDVRNFGAIVRTAECAGADAVIFPAKGSASINADAIKTSAGALHHMPICRVKDLEVALKNIKSSGIRVVGLTEKTDKDIYNNDLSGPVALLLGSEDTGIHPKHLRHCDVSAKIPMHGKIDSLNVSVSAAVGLYEIVRQRG
ncbi:MAG: 23S rRNA (guanosine(2251)-2'-O)-methyltransferase RlmB [Candidatus Cyclobacteriaceae bacterium M2_1C_046]